MTESGVEDATRRTRLANERTYLLGSATRGWRSMEDALDRGSFAPLGSRVPFWLLVAGAGLGTAAIAIVIFAH